MHIATDNSWEFSDEFLEIMGAAMETIPWEAEYDMACFISGENQ